jgi:hypothetical protein
LSDGGTESSIAEVEYEFDIDEESNFETGLNGKYVYPAQIYWALQPKYDESLNVTEPKPKIWLRSEKEKNDFIKEKTKREFGKAMDPPKDFHGEWTNHDFKEHVIKPHGWQVRKDHGWNRGKKYYYNPTTKQAIPVPPREIAMPKFYFKMKKKGKLDDREKKLLENATMVAQYGDTSEARQIIDDIYKGTDDFELLSSYSPAEQLEIMNRYEDYKRNYPEEIAQAAAAAAVVRKPFEPWPIVPLRDFVNLGPMFKQQQVVKKGNYDKEKEQQERTTTKQQRNRRSRVRSTSIRRNALKQAMTDQRMRQRQARQKSPGRRGGNKSKRHRKKKKKYKNRTKRAGNHAGFDI